MAGAVLALVTVLLLVSYISNLTALQRRQSSKAMNRMPVPVRFIDIICTCMGSIELHMLPICILLRCDYEYYKNC